MGVVDLGFEAEGVEVRHHGGMGYSMVLPQEPTQSRTAPASFEALLVSVGVLGAKHIPTSYLRASEAQRRALLSGLLDTDGGPVVQKDRTARVQYTTISPRLRDDVVDLVRSLGGVAYCRTRPAAGRKPGLANGRPVYYRHDAYILDMGSKVWQLNTKGSVGKERFKAAEFAQALVNERATAAGEISDITVYGTSLSNMRGP